MKLATPELIKEYGYDKFVKDVGENYHQAYWEHEPRYRELFGDQQDKYAPQPKQPPAPEKPPEGEYDLLGGVKDVGKLLYDVPVHTLGSVGKMFEDDDPEANYDWKDELRKASEQRSQQRIQELGSDADKKIVPGMLGMPAITRGSIARASASSGYSGVSMGGAIAGGLAAVGAAGLVATAPISAAAGAVIYGIGAMISSGTAAYNMSKPEATLMFADAMNESLRQTRGFEMTREERAEFVKSVDTDATLQALAEAGPEAAGNVLALKGLSEIFKGMVKSSFGKVAVGAAMELGGELAQETATELLQHPLLKKHGLSEGDLTVYEALKRVYPETMVITALMGGGSATAGYAWKKIVGNKDTSLPPETTDDPNNFTQEKALSAMFGQATKEMPTTERQQIANDLNNQEDINARIKAVEKIEKAMMKADKNAAETWASAAMEKINANEPIELDKEHIDYGRKEPEEQQAIHTNAALEKAQAHMGELQRRVDNLSSIKNPSPKMQENLARLTAELNESQQAVDSFQAGLNEQGEETAIEQEPVVEEETELAGPTSVAQGAETKAYANNKDAIDFRYEIVDLNDVVTSSNKNYTKYLQPRDRKNRKALQAQQENIAGNLKPEMLGENISVKFGAPTLADNTNEVESGNGRTDALKLAYQTGRADHYRKWVEKSKEKYGIDPEKSFDDIEQPGLFRRRLTPMDKDARIRFTQQANEPDLARMSATEQAAVDADNIKPEDLDVFDVGDFGNMNASSNQTFLTRFIDKMSPAERNGYVDEDGKANKQLIDRVQAAVFHKAYGSKELSSMVSEDADPDVRSVLNGLTSAAPSFVKARGLQEDHAGIDIVDQVTEAVNLLRRAKSTYSDAKGGVAEKLELALSQGNIFGDQTPAPVKDIARIMATNIRSGKRIGEFFKAMGDGLSDYLAGMNQQSLFGDKPTVASADLVEQAKGLMDEKYSNKQASLFGQEGTQGADRPDNNGLDTQGIDESEPVTDTGGTTVENAGELETAEADGEIGEAGEDTVTEPEPEVIAESDAEPDVVTEANTSQNFKEMVADAERWRIAGRKADAMYDEDDKSARLGHSKITTKGDLDAYLMKKYGIDEAEARNISNAMHEGDELDANIEDYADEPWAKAAIEYRAKKDAETDIKDAETVAETDTDIDGIYQKHLSGHKPSFQGIIKKTLSKQYQWPDGKARSYKQHIDETFKSGKLEIDTDHELSANGSSVQKRFYINDRKVPKIAYDYAATLLDTHGIKPMDGGRGGKYRAPIISKPEAQRILQSKNRGDYILVKTSVDPFKKPITAKYIDHNKTGGVRVEINGKRKLIEIEMVAGDAGTPTPQSPQAENAAPVNERVSAAYQKIVGKDQFHFSDVSISDLVDETGMDMKELHEFLKAEASAGRAVLSESDWSLSSQAEKDAHIQLDDGEKATVVRFIKPKKDSANAPQAENTKGKLKKNTDLSGEVTFEQFLETQSGENPKRSIKEVIDTYKENGEDGSAKEAERQARNSYDALVKSGRIVNPDTVAEAPKAETETATAPNDVSQELLGTSDEDIDAMFDDVISEKEPGSTTAPEPEPKTEPETKPAPEPKAESKPDTARDLAGKVALESVKGVQDAVKGLSELFTPKNTLSSGLIFNEETYAAAKPHFESAWIHAKEAGYNLQELIKYIADQFGKEIKPYLKRFLADKRTELEQDQFVEAIAGRLRSGDGFKDIRDARKFGEEQLGKKINPGTDMAKRFDEQIEQAANIVAREIAQQDISDDAKFDELLALQNRMPNLSVRTSTSMRNQAYSTPLPLAFVASNLAGVKDARQVYEPSGGHGALVMEAKKESVSINELEQNRYEFLKKQGFKTVTNKDAMQNSSDTNDAIVANPPFGVVKNQNGENESWTLHYPEYPFTTTQIDQAISLKALDGLTPDGKAVLILGSISKLAKADGARKNAYRQRVKAAFYKTLYDHYNVVDHFTVSGDLYKKQGAAWPVDVIVIHGRGKSQKALPGVEPPNVLNTNDELKEKLNETYSGMDAWENGTGGLNAGGTGGVDETGAADDDTTATGTAGGQGTTHAGNGGRWGRRPGVGNSPTVGTGMGGQGSIRPGAGGNGESTRSGTGNDSTESVLPGGTESNAGGIGTGLADGANNGEQPGSGTSAERPAGHNRVGVGDDNSVNDGSKFQTKYKPQSKSNSMNTLVPTNMAAVTKESLHELEDEFGKIDEYVADKLGYKLEEVSGDGEKLGYFSAEQVDAIAMAIYNIDRGAGFIIGDQTGTGKGRVVAAMIRYAMKNNLTPIFMTEKPNLYADMYRDLSNIGMGDMHDKILITNAGKTIPLTESGDIKIKTKKGAIHNDILHDAIAAGKLPDKYKIVFTTYDQLNETPNAPDNPRRHFIERMATNNGMLIMDESHNASGQGGSQRPQRGKVPRSLWLRQIIPQTSGVFYSSATYSKRPDVMDLYSKTDMRLAVDDISELGAAIGRGGVPMQQSVAAMLVQAKQYIRREQSFDGVQYNVKKTGINVANIDNAANAFANIKNFDDTVIGPIISGIKDGAATTGGTASGGSAAADIKISSTGFSSVMHNLVSQFLLAQKTQGAIDEAIKSHKNGEKVILTLSNTMGSFIQKYAEDHGLQNGDGVGLSFNDLIAEYLDKTRRYSTRDPITGAKTPHYITDEELGPQGLAAFNRVKKMIYSIDLKSVPISPIDHIKHELEKHGIRTGEITGRQHTVAYDSDGNRTYQTRGQKDVSSAAKTKIIYDYNYDNLDVLVINRSGSTGLSLHALPKWDGHKPAQRHMIILQAEANIDTHMQMLGRIHRVGQIVPPKYTQLMGDTPAEKRPAAVLARKMKSLNANTTADTDSDVTTNEVTDFMNKYGDQVVANIMADYPEIHNAIGAPLPSEAATIGDLTSGATRLNPDNAAAKVTGKLPMLPSAVQEQVYAMIESEYKLYLEQLDAMGENDLEAKTYQTDAITRDKIKIFDGTGTSPFEAPAYAELVDMKRISKPYKTKDVKKLIKDELFGDNASGKTIQQAIAEGERKSAELIDEKIGAFDDYASKILDDIETPERLHSRQHLLETNKSQWRRIASSMPVGRKIELPIGEDSFLSTVIRVFQSGTPNNPLAMGTWRVTFAVPDSIRRVTYSFNQLTSPKVSWLTTEHDSADLSEFDEAGSSSRENRIILTGNMLAAYSRFMSNHGRIINFTDNQGEVKQGVLMPANFNINEEMADRPHVFKDVQQAMQILDAGHLGTTDDGLTVARIAETYDGKEYLISAPSARNKGGRYFLDTQITDIIGSDFVRRSNRMAATVIGSEKMQQVLDYLMNQRSVVFKNKSNPSQIRTLLGINDETMGGQQSQQRMGEQINYSISSDRKKQGGDDVMEPYSAPQQKIDSAATSINETLFPTTFKSAEFLREIKKHQKAGKVNILDIGAGKFNNVKDFFEKGKMTKFPEKSKRVEQYYRDTVKPIVDSMDATYNAYDPFNRNEAENKASRKATENGQADIVVNNSVLNVIDTYNARQSVYATAANALKPDGKAFFLLFESDSTNVARETTRKKESKMFQNAAPSLAYAGEIKKYFKTITRKSNMIIAENPIKNADEIKSRKPDSLEHKWKSSTGEKVNGIEVLKNYSGSKLTRGKEPTKTHEGYKVGKYIGGQLYFHKDYLHMLPYNIQALAEKGLKALPDGFEYNTMMYDERKEIVRFDNAPDFDTAAEPVPGDYVSFSEKGWFDKKGNQTGEKVTGGFRKQGKSSQIWHHKWMWVRNAYKGFDVAKSHARSEKFLGRLIGQPSGKKEIWDEQLDDIKMSDKPNLDVSKLTPYQKRKRALMRFKDDYNVMPFEVPKKDLTIHQQNLQTLWKNLFNRNVVFYKVPKGTKANRTRGWTLPSNPNDLFINAAPDKPRPYMFTIAHEFMHSVESEDKELFDWLATQANNFIRKEGVEAFVEEKAHYADMGRDPLNEFYPEMFAEIMNRKEFWEQLFEADRTMAQKLLQYLIDLVNKIKAYARKEGLEFYFNDVDQVIKIASEAVKQLDSASPGIKKEKEFVQVNGDNIKYQVAAWRGGAESDNFTDTSIIRDDQAYGWGWYFSDIAEVANKYFEMSKGHEDSGGLKAYVYKVLLHKGKKPEDYAWFEWEKEVANQEIGEDLKNVCSTLFDFFEIDNVFSRGATGGSVYRAISSTLGSDKKASEWLRSNGIDGIRYKAENEQGQITDNKFNYVMFDNRNIHVEQMFDDSEFLEDKEMLEAHMAKTLSRTKPTVDKKSAVTQLRDIIKSTPTIQTNTKIDKNVFNPVVHKYGYGQIVDSPNGYDNKTWLQWNLLSDKAIVKIMKSAIKDNVSLIKAMASGISTKKTGEQNYAQLLKVTNMNDKMAANALSFRGIQGVAFNDDGGSQKYLSYTPSRKQISSGQVGSNIFYDISADNITRRIVKSSNFFVSKGDKEATGALSNNKLTRLFESVSDRLIKSEAKQLQALGHRINSYYDNAEKRQGWWNGKLKPHMDAIKKMKRNDRDKFKADFEAYWREHDNGRHQQAQAIMDQAHPKLQGMIDTVKDVFHESGLENQQVGMKVWDGAMKKWRPIGKIRYGKFWPRAMKPEISRVMSDTTYRHRNPELWEQMKDALLEDGLIADREEALNYLTSYFSSEVGNDYFANVEKARGSEKLPEMFYDYSFDVLNRYAYKWSTRLSQVEQFGQAMGEKKPELFDQVLNSSIDNATKDYLDQVKKQVYGIKNRDFYSAIMDNLNLLATGTQLGNPATATLNLLGGTTLNVQMFGLKNVVKSFGSVLKDWRNIQKEGTELGILGKDVMQIMRDTDNSAGDVLTWESTTKKALAKFANATMTWGGYRGTENVIRSTAMIAAKYQLQDMIKHWSKNPTSATSEKYKKLMAKNDIKWNRLAAENGDAGGAETSRYLRKMVNIPQGSYRIDQTPLYVDTRPGRFFFKYQKFGTQVSKMFYDNFFHPFMTAKTGAERAQHFWRMTRYFASAAIGGSLILSARSAVFGMNDPGPDDDDIAKAFENKDMHRYYGYMMSRAYHSMMAASALGFFGNYIQFGLDVADQQRVKNPLDPPGLATLDAPLELVRRWMEQGTLTAKDLSEVSERFFAFYRGYKRAATGLSADFGSEWKQAKLEQARRERMYVRKSARMFSDELGIEKRRTSSGGRIGKTPMSPTNAKLYDAIVLGNKAGARQIILEAVRSANDKDTRKKTISSMRASMRARQPLSVAGTINDRERVEFYRWAAKNLSGANYMRVRNADVEYRRMLVITGLSKKIGYIPPKKNLQF